MGISPPWLKSFKNGGEFTPGGDITPLSFLSNLRRGGYHHLFRKLCKMGGISHLGGISPPCPYMASVNGCSRLHLSTLATFVTFAQFIPFSIFAICISFVFYAPFVPFKSFRMIGNSWVSRILRNSITRSDMPSALVNCDFSTCFLQQKLKNEWNHVFVPFSTCSWFCSLATIFAVFARAQIVEASIV